MRNILAAAILCMAIAPMALADIIVLKSGKHFEIEGSYEVKGKNALFKDSKGELIQIPLSMIDTDKSRQANEAAEAARQAKANEVVVTTPKPPSSLQAVADSIDSTNKDGSPRTVSISNKGLKEYTDNNDRASDSRILSGGAPSTSSADAPKSEGSGPTVDQLSDPAFMAEARKKAGEEIGKLEKELSDLKASIDDAERIQSANEESAAFQDGPIGDGDVDKGSVDDDEGTNPLQAQLDATTKALKTLKEKKAQKEAELAKAKEAARAYGVRSGIPPKEEAAPKKVTPPKEAPRASTYREKEEDQDN